MQIMKEVSKTSKIADALKLVNTSVLELFINFDK